MKKVWWILVPVAAVAIRVVLERRSREVQIATESSIDAVPTAA